MSEPATELDERRLREQELVERLSAGEEEAFETLVREYGPRMLAVTRRLLGREEDAADALQDALLSAAKNIGGFEGNSLLSTWLHRIAANAALMKLRKRRSRPERSIDDLLPKFSEDGRRLTPVSGWSGTADELSEREEVRARVRERIEDLPEDYRNVILLRDIEQLDTLRTSEILEISEGAVKTRLHRARQALRALLEAEFA